MILSARDPAALTPEERRLEVAGLLAVAYLRILLARKESRNGLDQRPALEAPCARTVDGPERAAPGKESA